MLSARGQDGRETEDNTKLSMSNDIVPVLDGVDVFNNLKEANLVVNNKQGSLGLVETGNTRRQDGWDEAEGNSEAFERDHD